MSIFRYLRNIVVGIIIWIKTIWKLPAILNKHQTSLDAVSDILNVQRIKLDDISAKLIVQQNALDAVSFTLIGQRTELDDISTKLIVQQNALDVVSSTLTGHRSYLDDTYTQLIGQKDLQVINGRLITFYLLEYICNNPIKDNNLKLLLDKKLKIGSIFGEKFTLNYFKSFYGLFGSDNFYFMEEDGTINTFLDVYYIWGISYLNERLNYYMFLIENKKNVVICEDGFIRSIYPWFKDVKPELRTGCSFTVDTLTCYYDATRPSLLENMLNSNLVINEEQILQSKSLIKKIIDNKITKYNHQKIVIPMIGSLNKHKVLVVDQSYGDFSIIKGFANKDTFTLMLEAAIQENPYSDIIVKVHPDTIAQNDKVGYFDNIEENDHVFILREEINPISLIEYVDKVYVVTTQLGFEALMCKKPVVIFGMPFYAGWGLADERVKCNRRKTLRSLEEVFYITYVLYSHYVNPKTLFRCSIDEIIDYILELRINEFGK